MKKLTLVTLSTLSLSAALPSLPIFAQDDVETTLENSLDTEENATNLEEDEEASDLQKALEKSLDQFKKDYSDVKIDRVVVQPYEEDEDQAEQNELEETIDDVSEAVADDQEEADTTSLEEDELLDSQANEEDQDPYKISIEGLDSQDQAVAVAYHSITGEEIVEDDTDELTNEAEDLVQEAEDLANEAEESVLDEAEDLLGQDTNSESAEESDKEPIYLDFDAFKTFDEIKEKAEEEAGFGQALEFTYSINEESLKAEVEVVVYEDPENPLEGKQAQITLDPETLEIIKVEGTMDEEAQSQVTTKPVVSQPTTDNKEETSQADDDKEASEEESEESQKASDQESEEKTEESQEAEAEEATETEAEEATEADEKTDQSDDQPVEDTSAAEEE